MAGSKKYRGKQCAYCGEQGVSREAEHVLARSFFLDEDKNNLPIVPACRKCNSEKERLENYIQMIFMLGNRHIDAQKFTNLNLIRRTKKRQKLLGELLSTAQNVFERQESGLVLPTRTLNINTPKILKFYALIVRGLYYHHTGRTVPEYTRCEAFLYSDKDAADITERTREALGPNSVAVNEDIGRGTLRYSSLISKDIPGASFWIISIMGGIVFGSDRAGLGYRNVYTFTVPETMVPEAYRSDSRPNLH